MFLWDDFNREHATSHGVGRKDSEFVIENAAAPFPRRREAGKFLVWGPDRSGRIVEVVYCYRVAEELNYDSVSPEDIMALAEQKNVVVVYIIHAMPLDGRRLKQYRRTRR
jgi:hypothetical protein